MIKIYCLVDPFTQMPFYIGATAGKLYSRLANHISGMRNCNAPLTGIMGLRYSFFKYMLATNTYPEIKCLIIVSKKMAAKYEEAYYWHFRNQGIILLQDKYRFTYDRFATMSIKESCSNIR